MKSMQPVKQLEWRNIVFFSITTFFAIIGTPLYIIHSGLSAPDVLLFFFYILVTSLSVTMGYHRLFAHATFKTNAFVRFLVLFFGAASFQQSALKWASQHRDHHRYVDTDQDPYSIKKGFFYAHMGWLIFWKHPYHYENSGDLKKSRLVMNQHRFYILWALSAGVFLPLILGALTGHILGAFLLSVCLRITFVYHSTWCINSVCHTFGKATYDIYSSAKDHWLAALITNGEGYHNYHHHFPVDYRNGVLWYQWDPTKWIIAILERLGLAWDLKKVSQFRIIAARLAAENQRMEDQLLEKNQHPGTSTFRDMLQLQYGKLKQTLSVWEHSARDYEAILRHRMMRHGEVRREAALKNLLARTQFQEMLAKWKLITRVKFQPT